jgi:hypothetical protein
MATYNWSFRPNVPNKYNLVVSDTPDDVKPGNCAYVAIWGNDNTGNGSRMYPWRTLNRALSDLENSGQTIIFGAGVYREYIDRNINLLNYIGDGDVKFDFSYHNNWSSRSNGVAIFFKNIKFIGNGNNSVARASYQDCSFDLAANGDGSGEVWLNNIVSNTDTRMMFVHTNDNTANNNTFFKCTNIKLGSLGAGSYTRSNIYSNCNITIDSYLALASCQYSLFHQCNFKLTIGGSGSGTTLFPTVPDGFSYFDNIDDLREALILAASNDGVNLVNPLYKCLIADPKFNNPAIGDYSLSFDSPAKNASYFGTYIGAESIGYPILARSDSSVSGFDDDTNQNLIIADNSIVLADATIDASIETKVIPNLSQRELSKAPLFGFNADRNGQYIDSFADLDTTEIPATENLKPYTPYLVGQSAITYNGAAILTGERFTTTSVVNFTTENGGVCIEIFEAPQRHTILARSGNGGETKIVGDNLTAGFWYYVTGSVTHNGKVYSDQTFKATSNSGFTGTGNVIEALTVETYQHYEPGIKFTSNNVGNERLGEIIRGNGDPDYERGTGKEFPINARFIQIKYIIRVNNLKP